MNKKLNLSQQDMLQVEVNMKLRKITSMDVQRKSLLAILAKIEKPIASDPEFAKWFVR